MLAGRLQLSKLIFLVSATPLNLMQYSTYTMSAYAVPCVVAGLAVLLTWGLWRTNYTRVIFELVRIRVRYKHVRMKSDYYWNHRHVMPRVLRWAADCVLGVDSTNCLLDKPTTPSKSVRIHSAVACTGGVRVDAEPFLSARLRALDKPGASDSVFFVASDLCLAWTNAERKVVVDISYRGHSNPLKKIPAKDYSVRYVLSTGEVARFPPYGLRERQRKGFGVRKIKHAYADGYNNLDVTALAQTWAGPRHNFYADCEDASVVKNYVDLDCDTVVAFGGDRKLLLHPYQDVE